MCHGESLIIGLMGGGMADTRDTKAAYRLGSLIVGQGWILLNGGRSHKANFYKSWKTIRSEGLEAIKRSYLLAFTMSHELSAMS
jgi:hypothetical protein